ncbi:MULTISPECIES: hypothetical protein [unclassified Microcoleus]|uniref:hypothetical protein n=1 Tax=unclassified Microcoleus TaxID=2642155 RepID=UPI002FD09FCB
MEQAEKPVHKNSARCELQLPQEINFIVEQAEKPVHKNSARCELPPAEPLKKPVSLILVHHPKSDFNSPFIIESASTHILCVDAVSTALR